MVLEKGIIPPIANFEKLNSRIDAEFSHMKVNSKEVPVAFGESIAYSTYSSPQKLYLGLQMGCVELL